MNTLRTARVLIVDDSPTEAIPIVEALGRLGIGCVYVSGVNVEDIERLKPFRGIRVAFVDMKLDVEGTAREVVGKTAKVVKSVLSEDTLPVVFVAWTRHPDYAAEFTRALRQEFPAIQPLIVHKMEKPIRADGEINVAKTLAALRRLLTQNWPLGVLWSLEQMAHEAATDTTQSVVNAVAKDSPADVGGAEEPKVTSWLRALKSILQALIVAGAGKSTGCNRIEGGND